MKRTLYALVPSLAQENLLRFAFITLVALMFSANSAATSIQVGNQIVEIETFFYSDGSTETSLFLDDAQSAPWWGDAGLAESFAVALGPALINSGSQTGPFFIFNCGADGSCAGGFDGYFYDQRAGADGVVLGNPANAFLAIPTSVTTVPVPAAAWLFGTALLGGTLVARRRRRNSGTLDLSTATLSAFT